MIRRAESLQNENVMLETKHKNSYIRDMNKLALAVGGDGADRPQRPETPDPSRPKAQSHIRAARPASPRAKVPETGPMADMLKKLFGKDK